MATTSSKDRFIAAIETTGDPLAPARLHDAHNAVNHLGRLMTHDPASSLDATNEYAETLLSGFDRDMEHIANDPSFVCALCSILDNALIAYASNLKRKS